MTPKKKTLAHCADKRKKMDNLGSILSNTLKDTIIYAQAPIIPERFVDLTDLKDYFIPGCFQDRGWTSSLEIFMGYVNP